jgi:hypothetical protein
VSGPLVLSSLSLPAGFTSGGFTAMSLANGAQASLTVTLTAANPGLFQAPLTFSGNDTFNSALASNASGNPNQHSILLSGLVTDTADHWRQNYFGAGTTNSGNAADTANPSGDGIANLLKYALGLDPNVAYPPGTVGGVAFDGQGHLSIAVTKNPAATDVSLVVEVAGNLDSPAAWNTAGATIDQNTMTKFQAHDNTPIENAPHRFIRLKVTRP